MSVCFLYLKHDVGNDSTISEWIINYSGGFTKRGLIGQISIYFSRFFDSELRDIILYFQVYNNWNLFYFNFHIFEKYIFRENLFVMYFYTCIFALSSL